MTKKPSRSVSELLLLRPSKIEYVHEYKICVMKLYYIHFGQSLVFSLVVDFSEYLKIELSEHAMLSWNMEECTASNIKATKQQC